MNCDNTARIPNQVQTDIDTVVDDDDADNNECDTDFSILLNGNNTKMQCDDEYHKAGVEVLDQIIKKFNNSKQNSTSSNDSRYTGIPRFHFYSG